MTRKYNRNSAGLETTACKQQCLVISRSAGSMKHFLLWWYCSPHAKNKLLWKVPVQSGSPALLPWLSIISVNTLTYQSRA